MNFATLFVWVAVAALIAAVAVMSVGVDYECNYYHRCASPQLIRHLVNLWLMMHRRMHRPCGIYRTPLSWYVK